MGIRLRQAGIEDFAILERADSIGGTWRDNSYPGCAVDVQSHLYSYSFAPNPNWSRVYAPQEEIWSYIRRCADEFGVNDHVRFGHEVLGADWDESRQRWHDRDLGRPARGAVPDLRDGTPQRPLAAGHPRPRHVRGRVLPLGGVGPRLRPGRQARRCDRHRRVGRPARPGDPAEGRQAARLPAHAALDLPAHEPPHHPGRARALPALPRAPAVRARPPVLVPRDPGGPTPAARSGRFCSRRSRERGCAGRSPIPSCARRSRPATASAASASSSPTTTTRPSRARTSSW